MKTPRTPDGMSLAKWLVALGLLLGFPAPAAAGGGTPPVGSPGAGPAPARYAATALERLPLRFEENRGQADPAARFLARGPGFSLSLSAEGCVFVLPRRKPADLGVPPPRAATLRMAFKGADPAASVVGRDERPEKTNYLLGGDPSKWLTGIGSWGRVELRDLYPGIDLVFYGTGRQLEYDFVLAPGADPDLIRLAFTGEDSIEIDPTGSLVLGVGGEAVVQHAPVVYQESAGERRRLDGFYLKTGPHEVGFRIPVRDEERRLFIDPVLSFSTFLGGSGDDFARGVALDPQRNVYVTGYTNSLTFPGTGGTTGTDFDAFVTKINAAGSLVYSTILGGSGDDYGYAIAVNAAGEAYVTGRTLSTDFPLANAYQATRAGTDSVYFMKLNAAGDTALYSTYLGGSSGTNIGYAIAVDGSGRAYVAGGTASSNFPTAGTPFQGTFGGLYDAFVAKFNPSLSGASSLVYSTFLGWSSWEYVYAIAVDGAGSAFVAGETSSFTTSREVLVAKLDAAGSALDYGVYFGGKGDDYGYGIAIDGSGNAYVTGQTASSDFPVTTGAFQTMPGGALEAFVAKLDPTGANLDYSTYLGGGSDDTGRAIAVDAAGNAFVTGDTSTSFPVQNPLPYTGPSSNRDAFVTEMNPTGTGLVFSTRLGGSGTVSGGDKGFAIAVDALGSIYVAGQTDSTNFPTVRAVQPAKGDAGTKFDAFLTKIGTPPPARFYTVPPCRVLDTRVSPSGPFAGPALQPGVSRSFPVSAAPCLVPADAASISANATVTGASQPGFLTLFPADATRPLASSINFSAGQTRANNVVLPLSRDGSGAITAFAGSAGAVQFILDVNGYFK